MPKSHETILGDVRPDDELQVDLVERRLDQAKLDREARTREILRTLAIAEKAGRSDADRERPADR